MKASCTYDFSDEERAALALHVGQKKKYSRKECSSWMWMTVRATMETLLSDAEQSKEEENR